MNVKNVMGDKYTHLIPDTVPNRGQKMAAGANQHVRPCSIGGIL
jgi:hypothetical protein